MPPAAGSGILRVTKTLLKTDGTALTDAELIQAKENLHFTVVNSDRQIVGDFSGSAMQADSINPNMLQYTLELPLADSNGNSYNYAVTETARGEPTGYDCTLVRTVKDGGVWTDVTDTPIHSGIALTAQAATNIQFENTYARATGSLTITKQLPDDADDALQADFAETVNTFTIASVAAGSYTPQYSAGARPADAPAAVSPDSNGRLTLSIKGAGSVTLPGLAPAGYTVTESAAPDLTNYYLTTPTADRTQSLDVTAGGTAEAHFTNTYEPYLSVTITKKVVGDMGDTTKNFSFTATLDTTKIRQGSAYTTAGDGAALTDTGFTLRSGGSLNISAISLGLGEYAAPMGTGAALILLACGLFLWLQKDVRLGASVSFVVTCALIAFLFPRQVGVNGVDIALRLQCVRDELLTGAMLFSAVFLLNEPYTCAHHHLGRILYGVLVGAITMGFRYYGVYETGVCFALLTVNSISGWMDRTESRLYQLMHRPAVGKEGAE